MIYRIDNLLYNTEKLLKEAKLTEYKPFESGIENHWSTYFPEYRIGKINTSQCAEVFRLLDIIKKISMAEDIRPRFYKLNANTEVPMHKDTRTKCALNIVLNNNYGPILFEGQEKQFYKCAILDTRKRHSVPSFPEERILLKYSIFDLNYNDMVRRFKNV